MTIAVSCDVKHTKQIKVTSMKLCMSHYDSTHNSMQHAENFHGCKKMIIFRLKIVILLLIFAQITDRGV